MPTAKTLRKTRGDGIVLIIFIMYVVCQQSNVWCSMMSFHLTVINTIFQIVFLFLIIKVLFFLLSFNKLLFIQLIWDVAIHLMIPWKLHLFSWLIMCLIPLSKIEVAHSKYND
eukprot:459931_1